MRKHIATNTAKVVVATAMSALFFGTGGASFVATTAGPAAAAVSPSAANMIPHGYPWV